MKFVLVGGEEWVKDDGIDAYLAKAAGGEIGLIAFAAEAEAPQRRDQMAAVYEPLGCQVKLVEKPEDLAGLKAVYLSGGDPDVLNDKMRETGLDQTVLAAAKDGMVVAGSSAGAIVMCDRMIAHECHRKSDTDLMPGLGWLHLLVSVHWNEAKPDWQERFVACYADEVVVGVDESTALIWEDGQAEVLGLGKVELRGARQETYHTGDRFELELAEK